MIITDDDAVRPGRGATVSVLMIGGPSNWRSLDVQLPPFASLAEIGVMEVKTEIYPNGDRRRFEGGHYESDPCGMPNILYWVQE